MKGGPLLAKGGQNRSFCLLPIHCNRRKGNNSSCHHRDGQTGKRLGGKEKKPTNKEKSAESGSNNRERKESLLCIGKWGGGGAIKGGISSWGKGGAVVGGGLAYLRGGGESSPREKKKTQQRGLP